METDPFAGRGLLGVLALLLVGGAAIADVPKSLQLPDDPPAASERTAGEAKPWPQKGDTVYVSAKLEGFTPMTWMAGGYGGKMPDVPTLEPCEPMTVRKAAVEDGDTITVKDDMGHTRKLEESGWRTRMHRTEAECRATIKEAGAARVKSAGGYRYKLVLDQPAPSPPASPEPSATKEPGSCRDRQ
jgi:hypothetical protein